MGSVRFFQTTTPETRARSLGEKTVVVPERAPKLGGFPDDSCHARALVTALLRFDPRAFSFSQCERLMEDAVRYALGVVNDDVTPERACGAVGFCPAPEGGAFAPSPAMRATLIANDERTVEDARSAEPSPSAADCLKCKFGVEALHEAVTSNDTVAALLLKADDACEKYAAAFDLATTCEAAVATYAPEIVQKATAFLADAGKVCARIGMCPPPELGERDGETPTTTTASARFATIRGTVLKKMSVLDAVRGGLMA